MVSAQLIMLFILAVSSVWVSPHFLTSMHISGWLGTIVDANIGLISEPLIADLGTHSFAVGQRDKLVKEKDDLKQCLENDYHTKASI